MSSNELMKFTFLDDRVTGVYEYDDGRWERERIDSDEVYIYSQTGLVTKVEQEHGSFEISQYTDMDSDGLFTKYGEWRVSSLSAVDAATINKALSSMIVGGTEYLHIGDESHGLNESYVVNGVTYTETSDDVYVAADGSVIYETEESHELNESYVVNGVTYTETSDDVYVAADGSVIYETEESHELNESYVVNGVTYTETSDDVYVAADGSVIYETEESHELNESYVVNGVTYTETSDNHKHNEHSSLDDAMKLGKHWRTHEEVEEVFLSKDGTVNSAVYSSEDHTVSAADALLALKLAVGLEDSEGSSPFQYFAADVNKDGRVSASDALTILKMAVGISGDTAPEYVAARVDLDGDWAETGYHENTSKSHVDWDHLDNGLLSVDTSSNLIGFVLGDVNGSWDPSIVLSV